MSERIWTVSQLAQHCRQLLEQQLPGLWLEGEISGLMQAQSGHLYFNLKDHQACLKCVMFRQQAQRLSQAAANGQLVRVWLRASLYETRGDLQFTVERLQPAGLGLLQQNFLALKARLEAEGLFRPESKQPLPVNPKRLAVVTSAKGAALQDVLKVLKDRSPWLQIRVYSCLVQGEQAPASIRRALAYAIRQGFGQLVLICRGGGSFEDLFCFNDEQLVRDIAACPLPTLTGIGHETDFCLADFAADKRAATPSAAAELLSISRAQFEQRLAQLKHRLMHGLKQQLQHQRQRYRLLRQRLWAQHPQSRFTQLNLQLDDRHSALSRLLNQHLARYQHRLQLAMRSLDAQHPMRRLQQQAQRQQALQQRLLAYWAQRLKSERHATQALHKALMQACPLHSWPIHQHRLKDLSQRLSQQIQQIQVQAHARLAHQAGLLHQLSPLQTLHRGYSISRTESGPIDSVQSLQPGQPLVTLVADGRILSRIEALEPTDDPLCLAKLPVMPVMPVKSECAAASGDDPRRSAGD